MLKFVSVLAVAAIAMLIWALQPAPVKKTNTPKKASVVYEPTTGSANASSVSERNDTGTATRRANRRNKPSWSPKLPEPETKRKYLRRGTRITKTRTPDGKDPVATLPGLSKRESKDRPDILPHPVATEGEFAVKGYKEPGDKMDPPRNPMNEKDRFPRVAASQFKDSVRSYYENLPKSGVIPKRIMVDEVLPDALVKTIGIPAETELKMLGPHNVTDIKSFKYALDSPQGLIGLSYTTPDGQYHRKYVRLESDDKQ